MILYPIKTSIDFFKSVIIILLHWWWYNCLKLNTHAGDPKYTSYTEMEGLDQCLSPPHHDFSMYQKSLSFAVWSTQYVPRGAESTCIAAYLLGQGVMEVAVGQTYWRIHKKISKNGENISIQMDRILIQQGFALIPNSKSSFKSIPTQYDLTSPASTCKPKSPIYLIDVKKDQGKSSWSWFIQLAKVEYSCLILRVFFGQIL